MRYRISLCCGTEVVLVLCATSWCYMIGKGGPLETLKEKLFGSSETAKETGISLRQLYHWVDVLHVVQPRFQSHGQKRYRRFTQDDLFSLKRMKGLVERGFMPKAAALYVQQRMEKEILNEQADFSYRR